MLRIMNSITDKPNWDIKVRYSMYEIAKLI